MDKLEELKIQWQQMEVRVNELSEANKRLSEQLAKDKTVSLQTRLAKRIRQHALAGLALPILAPSLYYILMMPLWICLVYAFFGILVMTINLDFASSIKNECLVELPVASAIRRAVQIKMGMERRVLLGIMLAIPLLITLAYALPEADRETILLGGAVGTIIGGAIGLRNFLTNHRLAKRLIESVQDLQE